VSNDKQLSALTQEELDKICKNYDDQITSEITPLIPTDESTIRAYCTALGLMSTMSGGTKAACESSRDQCVVASSSDAGVTGAQDAGASTSGCWKIGDFAGCTATVTELNACNTASINAYKESIEGMKATWGSLTCDNAGQPLDPSVLNELTNQNTSENADAGIPECDVVDKKCPTTDGGV
jgi:hypothetical protein